MKHSFSVVFDPFHVSCTAHFCPHLSFKSSPATFILLCCTGLIRFNDPPARLQYTDRPNFFLDSAYILNNIRAFLHPTSFRYHSFRSFRKTAPICRKTDTAVFRKSIKKEKQQNKAAHIRLIYKSKSNPFRIITRSCRLKSVSPLFCASAHRPP